MSKRERVEIYAFDEAALRIPSLPGAVYVDPTVDELVDRITSDLVAHALNCVRQFGDFHLALGGGAALDPVYLRLMVDPDCRGLPWRRTHLWLTDERHAGERPVFRQIDETIVEHADIPLEQVHPFVASPTMDHDYEGELREALSWREKGHDRLDYALLLLQPDGAIAGLTPGAEVARETTRLVRGLGTPGDDAAGATMTLPLINAARFVAIVGLDAAVGPVIAELSERDAPSSLPAGMVAPLNGELRWYLDAAATARS